ncbi:MAG: VWA domain-containing protein [Ardenticatenales bacterium]
MSVRSSALRIAALALVGLATAATNAPRPAHAQSPLPEAWHEVAMWRSEEQPPRPGQFRQPEGIDVAPDGTIYVADHGLGVVHVLSAVGDPKGVWGAGTIGAPQDVAATADVIYVTEPDGDHIHRFDPRGTALGTWDLPGRPMGIAEWQGKLYVALGTPHEIAVLDTAGIIVDRWGGDRLGAPRGVAVGGDERVYVADVATGAGGANGYSVKYFDLDGTLLGTMPSIFEGVQLPPIDIAVDRSQSQVEKFILTELGVSRYRGAQGMPVAEFRSPGGRGLAVGPGSGLVQAVQDHRLGFTGIRHFPDRRADRPTPDTWGGPFAPLGEISRPRRISGNGDGEVWIVDAWPRVQNWTAAGATRAQFAASGLQDVAAGLRGSVYTLEGRTLSFRDRDGTALWQWASPATAPDASIPYGWLTAVDAFGNDVAVLDTGDQHVWILDFSGNRLSDWPVSPPDSFTSIGDLALAGDRIYMINRTTRRIDMLDRGDGHALGGFTVPGRARRIDVAPDGAVFVLIDEGWVWRLAADGTPRALWQVAGPREAVDITAGAADRAFVAIEDGRVGVYGPDAMGKPITPPEFKPQCQLTRDKVAAPTSLVLGDTTEVTLSIDGDCPVLDNPADIVLLVDTSGSMSGTKMGAARSAVLEFVGQLDYGLHQVALISFSTDVTLVQPLTNNPRALIRAIPELGDDAGTNMAAAMALAGTELDSPRARKGARQVVVLLSDGRPTDSADGVVSMASQFRSMGRDVYTIGLGLDVDGGFMRLVATAPNFYFEAPTEYDLVGIYDVISRRVGASSLLQSASVTDVVPADMAYLGGSAVPPARWDSASRTLSWQLGTVSPAGMRLRYKLRPQAVGRHPTNVRAGADVVDGVGVAGSIAFPVPEVTVRVAERWYAFLPVAFKEHCPEIRMDIALVIDTSNSMRDPAGGGGTKLDAAVYAAKVFLSILKLPGDRVAVIAFSGAATTVTGLSGDVGSLTRALDTLPTGAGTRIDLGLTAAAQALAARSADRLPAIVLLTDGQPSGTSADDVRAAAAGARASGILIYTIGLGPDADQALLADVAGVANRAFRAPDEAVLADIYRAIARAIPCGR